MNYYDEEFYHEPSEFEMMVDEFKGKLMNAVKEDYINEMDRLRKENEELQDVKKNFEQIKNDYEKKKREVTAEYETKKSQVRRERLSELMKDCEVELYTVGSTTKYKPKCNQCDENRKIHYKTPSGKDTFEMCECSSRIHIYEPIPTLISSFSIRNGKGHAWYKVQDRGRHDEYLSYYEDSISGSELITSEDQFDDKVYSYKTLFQTEELAQKYCDWKNRNSKEVDSNGLRKKN